MPLLPRPLLGVVILATSLYPGSVQGVPVDAHIPTQSWNVTAPGNSSHLVRPPPRPWAPVPFFWNPLPPRPYHEYGYGDFYQAAKAKGVQRGPPNAVHAGFEPEEVAEAETSDDGGREDADAGTRDDVNESDTEQQPDEGSNESAPDASSFWNPLADARHKEASKPDPRNDDNDNDEEQQKQGDDHRHEQWDWKERGHGYRMPWDKSEE